ncbi:MAG: penicillin acylase family protein [Polyangiales bacterium]
MLAALLVGGLLACGCKSDEPVSDAGPVDAVIDGVSDAREARTYAANITRTTDHVAHIVAGDVGSLGFGLGYVTAEDHLCKVADGVLWGRSEFSRFHGRGIDDVNLHRDLTYKSLDLYGRARRAVDGGPEDIRERLRGYAAGYNAYLEEVGMDGVSGWCAGGAWLRPIDEYDVAAFHVVLGTSPSVGPFASFIATASPPGEAGTRQVLPMPPPPSDGSNSWAIGRERSTGGTAMLMGNSHLSWEDRLHYHEVHLTIPGRLNAYGATIVGFPAIVHGFNEHTAWSITVSNGQRFTAYIVDLVPGEPTSYVYGGEVRAMSSREIAVDVLRDDGSLETVTQTMWSTHYGPVLSLPGVGWNSALTVTIRDGNEELSAAGGLFQRMNEAEDIDDIVAAHRTGGGMIAFNTIAADDSGEVWFGDTAATPNLSEAAIAAWRERLGSDFLTQAASNNGFVLLDGSNPRDEWVDDPAGIRPGLLPFDRLPQLRRTDYVFNANDSYRWTNPEVRLEGYSPLHGNPNRVTPRTRMNAIELSADQGGAGDDGLFTLDELRASALSNRVLTAELLVSQLVERCTATPTVDVDGEIVDLTEACTVLAAWDRRVDLESRGAILWREFVTRAETSLLFADAMDPMDYVHTPRQLTTSDVALPRLAQAVKTLQDAGHRLDVSVGEIQFAQRGSTRVPVHGGEFGTGVTNRVNHRPSNQTSEPASPAGDLVEGSRTLRTDGYPISGGTSFLLAVELGADGPRASAILAYGNTGDPASPDYVTQTRRLAEKNWRTVSFTDAAVAADRVREYTVGRGD